MKPLGLGYQKIDIYSNFCMLYYLKNVKLIECRTYWHTSSTLKPKTDREKTLITHKKLRYFSITLRLQMLFMLPQTTEHITWHHLHDAVDGVMVYPSDDEA